MASRRQVTFLINANATAFKSAMKGAEASFKRIGRSMQRTGRKLSRNISLPLAVIGGASIKMASDFEASMTKIETLVGLSRQSVQGMKSDVLALAKQTGRGPLELADALFAVTSAGLRGEQAMSTLEKAAKASAIGLGDTKDVARALTGILQSYSKQGLTAAEATDTLIGVVREGNLEASELAPVLGRVTGIASQLGISFQEVGASIASFTRLGVSSEEAVTGLRGILNALMKQTPKAAEALAGLSDTGINTFAKLKKAIRENGLARTLVRLTKAFEGNDKGLADFAGRVRGLAAITGTAQAQTESYLAIAKRLQDSTGNLDKGFKRVSETMQFKFLKAFSNLRTAGIELGTKMLPIITKLLDKISKGIDWFSGLSEASKELGLKIAGIALAIGPTLLLLGKLFTAISVLMSPTFLFGAAIATVFAGVVATGQWLLDNWDKISQGFENAMLTMKITAQKMALGVIKAITSVISFVVNKTPPGLLSSLFGIDLANFAFDITGVNKVMDDLSSSIESNMKDLSSGIQKYNEQAWGSFSDSAKHALDLTKNMVSGWWDTLTAGMPDFSSAITPKSTPKNPIQSVGVSTPSLGSMNIDTSLLDKYKVAVKDTRSVTEIALDGVREKWQSVSEELASNIAPMIGQAVADMTASFVSGIATIATTGGSLGGIFKGVLNTLANLAIRVGKIAIGIGIAIKGIKKALESLNPVAAVVAGIALIALGTFAKSALSNAMPDNKGMPGMANGGIVPSGFPNDTYPAMLTSGEMVVPQPHALPNNLGGSPEYVQTSVYLDSVKIATALNKAQKKTR